MDNITIKLSAIIDDKFTEELKEIIRNIIKEESKIVNYTVNISYPTGAHIDENKLAEDIKKAILSGLGD